MRLMKANGFDELRFHSLRHTFAVNSLRAGDDIKTVKENLGHATASFTLSTYAHSTPGMKKRECQPHGAVHQKPSGSCVLMRPFRIKFDLPVLAYKGSK